MESLAVFKNRMLNNPPECEICGDETDLILEGLNRSPLPPHLPVQYFLIFQCVSCGTNKTVNFAIKVFSSKAIAISDLR